MARNSLALARPLSSEEIDLRSDVSNQARRILRLVVDNEKVEPSRYRPTAKLLDRAAAHIGAARFEEGLARCERAITIDPEDGYAHLYHACALIGLGRFDDALEALDRALAHKPGFIWFQSYVHYFRGTALLALRRFDDGLAAAERAVALVPNDGRMHVLHANALGWLERFVDSLNAADRGLALNQKDGSAHRVRGNALFKLGQLADALTSADHSVALLPYSSSAHVLRANVLSGLRRYEEMLAEADRAIALSPNDVYAHVLHGRALFALDRFADALVSADETIALSPNDEQAHLLRGFALFELRRFAESLETAARLITLQDKDDRKYLQDQISLLLNLIGHELEIDESKTTRYTTGHGAPMGDETAAFHAVADDAFKRGLSVAELKEAIEEKLAAKGEIFTRENTARASERPRLDDAAKETTPPQAPAPAAPVQPEISENNRGTTKRRDWKEAKKLGETLPDFVRRVYADHIESGTLSKATLRGDKELYTDYYNWRRKPNLPVEEHWLRDLPTQKELYDQRPAPGRVEDFDPTIQEAVRLYQRSRQRLYRRARSPN